MVLAGSRGFWKYEGRGPPKLPLVPEKLAGRRVREEVEKERCDCGRSKRAVVVLPARRAALGGNEGIVENVWLRVCECLLGLAGGRELRIAPWFALELQLVLVCWRILYVKLSCSKAGRTADGQEKRKQKEKLVLSYEEPSGVDGYDLSFREMLAGCSFRRASVLPGIYPFSCNSHGEH